jgi:type IV fimbrial biogenesis protein FimT
MPFVCHKYPFICKKTTYDFPLVRIIIPFIVFSGFTLVELIITLTIAGILMSLAAPSMFGFLADNRLSAQVNEFITDISLARSEAIKRNTTAGICASTSGTSCTAAGNWAQGWMVYYVDETNNIVIVKVHEPLSGNNTLQEASAVDTVVYAKNGIVSNVATQLTFTLCDHQRRKARIVTLINTGRPAISESTCV